MPNPITQESYDTILDALDNENTDLFQELFLQYNLTPHSELFDTPREGYNDCMLLTYMDYVLSYNLKNILDFLIDTIGLEIDDIIIARSLELQNFETYKYILSLGYIPQIETLRIAVRNCYSEITENILAIDNDLIREIDDEDIEYLFSFDMDEETVETIRVLFNFGIDRTLFARFLNALKNGEDKYFLVSEEEQDVAIEIIEFLESNNVSSDICNDVATESAWYESFNWKIKDNGKNT
jgi:hypothetical protein